MDQRNRDITRMLLQDYDLSLVMQREDEIPRSRGERREEALSEAETYEQTALEREMGGEAQAVGQPGSPAALPDYVFKRHGRDDVR